MKKLDSKTSLESIGEAESETFFQGASRQVSTGASEVAASPLESPRHSESTSKENHISKAGSSQGNMTAAVPAWIYAIIFVQVSEAFILCVIESNLTDLVVAL